MKTGSEEIADVYRAPGASLAPEGVGDAGSLPMVKKPLIFTIVQIYLSFFILAFVIGFFYIGFLAFRGASSSTPHIFILSFFLLIIGFFVAIVLGLSKGKKYAYWCSVGIIVLNIVVQLALRGERVEGPMPYLETTEQAEVLVSSVRFAFKVVVLGWLLLSAEAKRFLTRKRA